MLNSMLNHRSAVQLGKRLLWPSLKTSPPSRLFASVPAPRSPILETLQRSHRLRNGLGAVVLLTAAAQAVSGGTTTDFYDYRFYIDPKANVDPDDLADFYGSENFMDIFCVMPFMGTLMMRGGYFDEEGTVHTTGMPGEMLVSMVFSDGSDGDEDEHGQRKNGVWFNKRERFQDICFGYTCWDMVTNFGFEKQPDGRILVYHHGEYFKSALPPISLIVKFVFMCHARWVAWATEHHLNHYAFRNATEVDEELERESREDMPLFLLKNYAWTDLVAAVFGRAVEKPSFLVKRSQDAAALLTDDNADEEEDEEEQQPEEIPKAPITLSAGGQEEESDIMENPLPVQRPAIMRRITMDIHFDRETSAELLHMNEDDLDEDDDFKDASLDQVLADRVNNRDMQTLAKKNTIVVSEGLQRTYTMTRRVTQPETKSGPKLTDDPELRRQNLGGGAAWEALRATNNPAAYKAATFAAQQRFTQRQATLRRASTLKRKDSNQLSAEEKGILRRASLVQKGTSSESSLKEAL